MTAVYVALGDSMSIDDYAGGPGCGAASLLHRNRDADFPDWAGRDLGGGEMLMLARDGVAAGDPTGPESRPANRDLWYCGTHRTQRLGRPRDPPDLVADRQSLKFHPAGRSLSQSAQTK